MNSAFELHRAVFRDDLARVGQLLDEGLVKRINSADESGLTPLMTAARERHVRPDIMRALIEAGADLEAICEDLNERGRTALSFAVSAFELGKVSLLLEAGADPNYLRHGYSSLLQAAFAAYNRPSAELVALLDLLLAHGAQLDICSPDGETALGRLSAIGQFDGVRRLLDAGADPAPLQWTRLHHALALGTLAEVNAALDSGENAEARDSWQRTPLLLAIQTGEQHKVELLLLHGVDRAARGAFDAPAMFFAIQARNEAMLKYLLAEGFSLHELDEFGSSALAFAAQHGCFSVTRALLDAGMVPDQHDDHRNALYCCESPQVARALLDAGADPQHLQFEMRRALLGLPPEPDVRLLDASPEDFQRAAHRRFGTRNRERIHEPFWQAMVRAGVTAWQAGNMYQRSEVQESGAIWCAQRFGQSISFLPDGRIIQVGGEHEDGYDPDFCIYNDVFVHHPDGRIEILGYPEAVFPPTDFHTATLLGSTLYLIGSLGYQRSRQPGVTPVYALDTSTLKIKKVRTSGENPGWIYRHRALRVADKRIRVFGGFIEDAQCKGPQAGNPHEFELDLQHRVWTRIQSEPDSAS